METQTPSSNVEDYKGILVYAGDTVVMLHNGILGTRDNGILGTRDAAMGPFDCSATGSGARCWKDEVGMVTAVIYEDAWESPEHIRRFLHVTFPDGRSGYLLPADVARVRVVHA
jgi:hypothetical protein